MVRLRARRAGTCRQSGVFEFRILKGDGSVQNDDGLVALGDLKREKANLVGDNERLRG